MLAAAPTVSAPRNWRFGYVSPSSASSDLIIWLTADCV